MIGIIPLSLMASGQTEPQQTTQGQTKESQATTLAKETKMRPAQEQSMKAIRVHKFGGPEVLRLEEVPTPQPGPGQVLVRMHAIGVNPIETYIRTGTYAYKPTLPYTPGNDGAGVIEEVGTDVNEFKPGDRVYTARSVSGTYAEFALCTTEQVHPLPANISFAQGAAIGTPYATAIVGCSSVATLSRAKLYWCTARAEVSGRRQCNWRALAVCACSVPQVVTKDESSPASKARTKCSITARRTISSRS